MHIEEIFLKGTFIITPTALEDERGFFMRTFCKNTFAKNGLVNEYAQSNLSYNYKKGTLRGMHYQVPPAAEVKLVQCIAGSQYDVIIDLRPESKTYCQWFGIELNSENRILLYVPIGFAHGFQTLTDNTIVYYHMSAFYNSDCEKGVRWDDPIFAIKWPLSEPVMSQKDRYLPDYQP